MATAKTLKSYRVRDEILQRIRTGVYQAGQPLPAEKDLADELGMNHQTVRKGLSVLSREGLIVKRPGVGNFVREVMPSEMVTQLAIVCPDWLRRIDTNHPAWTNLVKGVARAACDHRYMTSHLFYRVEHFAEDVIDVAVSRGVKGVLLWPQIDLPRSGVEALLAKGIKVVLVKFSHPALASLGLLSVGVDKLASLYEVMDKLTELGHRRILVTEYEQSPTRVQTEAVIDAVCREKGLGDVSNIMLKIPNPNEGNVDWSVLGKALDREPRPTAVVACDEYVVNDLLRATHQMGLRIPDDISLVAMQDYWAHTRAQEIAAPDPLLGVRVPEVATEYLMRLIDGEEVEERDVRLRCDIKWNGSVCPPSV
ncbi:MAG: GntR family transcriptional regulator [Sedimentisphaerales bacterium]|nr:GntR family transcriptional regulator [Sedimentisphaerales bacterium]